MRISPREAWIVSRLLSGRAIVEPGAVQPLDRPERILPLTDALLGVDVAQRPSVWRGFLAGRADAADWSGPVGEVDAMGPPPSDQGAGPRPRADLGDI